MASAGLASVGKYKVAGLIPISQIFSVSKNFGEFVSHSDSFVWFACLFVQEPHGADRKQTSRDSTTVLRFNPRSHQPTISP
jgi:hypothetical protein